ncbi:MAG: hypothetical protein WC492_04715 [Candidatus Micrarchaeia archaeon]
MTDVAPGKEFVFKMPEGSVVGRARNLDELIQLVKTAPLPAVLYHAKGNHFAPWLDMIGRKQTSKRLSGLVINDKTVRVALLRALRS